MITKEQLSYLCKQWHKVYNENLQTEYSGFYNTLKKNVRDKK